MCRWIHLKHVHFLGTTIFHYLADGQHAQQLATFRNGKFLMHNSLFAQAWYNNNSPPEDGSLQNAASIGLGRATYTETAAMCQGFVLLIAEACHSGASTQTAPDPQGIWR